jgi:ABC-type thiamin/hydroxymethylpyrimidine transport system permease subunit
METFSQEDLVVAAYIGTAVGCISTGIIVGLLAHSFGLALFVVVVNFIHGALASFFLTMRWITAFRTHALRRQDDKRES